MLNALLTFKNSTWVPQSEKKKKKRHAIQNSKTITYHLLSEDMKSVWFQGVFSNLDKE